MDPNAPTTAAQIEAMYAVQFQQQLAAQQTLWQAQLALLQKENQQLRASGAPPPP
jgi:hypothetical protein